MPSILKQKQRLSPNNLLPSLCKILLIVALSLFIAHLFIHNHNCSSSLQEKIVPSPTNISHLVFGLVTSVKTWNKRKSYIETWWRPNVTRGYLFLEEPPSGDLLPWPSSTCPPFRVSENTSELEKVHRYPIMVRMVTSILDTFKERDEGIRWYVMAFDDSILFVDNWVDVLAKYDHTKYVYIGGQSESIVEDMYFSFDMGFGGAGIALSYPLVKAMVKDLKGCIKRYNYVESADFIVQYCVEEYGITMTPHKGIHQIDLIGDISGFLSAHPQAPLLSLHHFDYINPIFPSKSTFQSTKHLFKAAIIDQSRLLQQTICYHKPKNWSLTISWGYSVHIYEKIYPRTQLKRPLETFDPWVLKKQPPYFIFNTRWPCEIPNLFYFDMIEKSKKNELFTSYVRGPRAMRPENCTDRGNFFAKNIEKIHVVSSTEKLKEFERSQCCDIEHSDGSNIVKAKLRDCGDDEIIG